MLAGAGGAPAQIDAVPAAELPNSSTAWPSTS
jgi:hypothetical protein